MKTCKSCGAILPDSFQLGDKCPNCKIKILYEENEQKNIIDKIGSFFSTLFSTIGFLFVIALIGLMIWKLASVPFMIHRGKLEYSVSNRYLDVMALVAKQLNNNQSKQNIPDIEKLLLTKISELEYLADQKKYIDKAEMFGEVILSSGEKIHGTGAKYISENIDNFKNERLRYLLKQILLDANEKTT